MKLAGLFAVLFAIPLSVLAQDLTPQNVTNNVITYINSFNYSAYMFADAASRIGGDNNFFFQTGPLYDLSKNLIDVTSFSMGGVLYMSWYPGNDTDATDGGAVVIDTLAPMLVLLNKGIGSIADKAALIPNNNNPLPALLSDFNDVFSRFILALQDMYPPMAPWLIQNWQQVSDNINDAKTEMSKSTATQTLQKRSKLCSPDNPTCNGIALPNTGINSFIRRSKLCSPDNPTCNGITVPGPGINVFIRRDAESEAQGLEYHGLKENGVDAEPIPFKRAKLCSPDNPTCNGIALPNTGINSFIRRDAKLEVEQLERHGLESFRSRPARRSVEIEKRGYYSVEQCQEMGLKCMLTNSESCLCL